MAKIIFVVLTITMLCASGCSGPLTGIVIDAETKMPIQGAIVHAEWFVTIGLGLTRTETYATRESETDKEGKFTISGVLLLRPSIDPPEVIIYKKGYVAWDSKAIYSFPKYHIEKRTDFRWGRDYVFQLESFKKEYSHGIHLEFIDSYLTLSPSFKDAISWERPLAHKESYLYRAKKEKKKYASEQEIYREIVKDLYLQGEDHK